MCSSPGEDDLFSLATRDDRKVGPRKKLFASDEALQERMPQPRKCVVSSSLGEGGGSFSWETKLDRSWEPEAELCEIVNCQQYSSSN